MGGRGASSSVITGKAALEQNPLIVGVPESQRKDYYYRLSNHGQEFLKRAPSTVMKEDLKYNNVVVNVDLPLLSGTPKQIKFADNLRKKELTRETEYLINKTGSMSNSQKDNLIAKANEAGASAKSFSDVINFLLKKNTKDVFLETSAKKIIDKYY